ncbi:hypothetical protein [Planktothrix mougeotii]|uniref:Aminoglycoside phosphotransferase domain-containing protein n=1 Tax=Planktothrix mougeotii LEGE 06226 TaxID=1828728 RepID=A0ABR9U6G1_9CYAN|nr:hypothetical protein [Planktothrix mougeotii]MBE9142007.1 hypothetical protein [Planktothrix mougeotii LEGE 06226]
MMKQSDLAPYPYHRYKYPISENGILNFTQVLQESLTEALGGNTSIGEISTFGQPKGIEDETTKFIIKDQSGRKIAVAVCSSPASPKIVARGVESSRLAKQRLGSGLGDHILQPLCEGEWGGLSYAALPYCQPLSNSRLLWYSQRFLLRPSVFHWLTCIAEATATKADSDEIQQNFLIPLKHLVELDGITDPVRAGAYDTLERLAKGTWSPYHVLMHSDLWKGNVLIAPSSVNNIGNRPWQDRFVIIDWPGGLIKGYGIYDLIRLAQSLKLGQRQLRKQVNAHCQILNGEFTDARCHLLAALSYRGMHLEKFPLARFAKMADSCLKTLEEIGG